MKRMALGLLAVVVWLGSAWGQPPSREEIRATVAYLRGLQNDDGGFSPSRPAREKRPPSSLRATTAALRALKYFDGEALDRPGAGKFIERCFDKASGGFADQPGGKPDVVSTAIGIMAVVEVKLPAEEYSTPVVRYLGKHVETFEDIRIAAAGLEAIKQRPSQADHWLEQLYRMRNADGTFGKGDGAARDTGGASVAILRLDGRMMNRDAVVNALLRGQRSDGGWGKAGAAGSDLDTGYRVMRALFMLNEKPNVGRCQKFVAACRNPDGGYGVAPGQVSTVAGTYFAAIILHWLEAK
jgi:prenyltransferase beta subunit